MAAGIASFVNGVFEGKAWRDEQNDRKRRQKLDDEGLARDLEDRARRQKIVDQELSWRQEDRAYTKEDRELSRADRARELSILDEDLRWKREDRARQAEEFDRAEAQRQQEEAARAAEQAVLDETFGGGSNAAAQPRPVPADAFPVGAGQGNTGYGARTARPALSVMDQPAAAPRPPTSVAAPATVPTAPARPAEVAGSTVFDKATGAPLMALPPRADAPASPAPASTTAAPGAAFAGTPTTATGTPVASVEAAAETAPKAPTKLAFGVTGKGNAVPATKAQYDRAAEAGVKAYAAEQMPKIVQFYLQNGQLEKAAAFQKFFDDKKTQDGMKSWMKAVHALNVGDTDTFVDGMIGAYNSYYDDGYTALKDQSELIKDDAGKLVSAKIAFRDEDTGKILFQEFNDIEDMVVSVIGKLSPEGAYDTLYEMMVAKKDGGKVDTSKIAETIKQLSDANLEFSQLPLAEQVRMATQLLATGDLSGSGAPTQAFTEDDI
jgi:hypothetical protein